MSVIAPPISNGTSNGTANGHVTTPSNGDQSHTPTKRFAFSLSAFIARGILILSSLLFTTLLSRGLENIYEKRNSPRSRTASPMHERPFQRSEKMGRDSETDYVGRAREVSTLSLRGHPELPREFTQQLFYFAIATTSHA